MDYIWFKTATGKVPFEDYVRSQGDLHEKIMARMEIHCEDYDAGRFRTDGVKVKPFPGAVFDGEIRVKMAGTAYRFPYGIDKQRRYFVLLDCFPKRSGKSNQWPVKDRKRAEARWKEYRREPEKHGAQGRS